MSVLAAVRTLGCLDSRLYYLATCCLTWHVFSVAAPAKAAKVEVEMAWYTIKAVTIVGRTINPLAVCVRDRIVYPLIYAFRGSSQTDNILLVGKSGEVVRVFKAFHMCECPFVEDDCFFEYEFVIYKRWCHGHPKHAAQMLRFDSMRQAIESCNDVEIKLSGIKFLAPRVVVDDTSIFDMSHELSTNNYYICGNRIFDRPFIAWYLKTHHKIDLDTSQYKVEFIDHKMVPQTITDNKVVIMRSDAYDISDTTQTVNQSINQPIKQSTDTHKQSTDTHKQSTDTHKQSKNQ